MTLVTSSNPKKANDNSTRRGKYARYHINMRYIERIKKQTYTDQIQNTMVTFGLENESLCFCSTALWC